MAIQIKRGTSAQRKVSEVVLEAGQPFLETDTGNLFVGKTGTEKLKDLTLDASYPSLQTVKDLGNVAWKTITDSAVVVQPGIYQVLAEMTFVGNKGNEYLHKWYGEIYFDGNSETDGTSSTYYTLISNQTAVSIWTVTPIITVNPSQGAVLRVNCLVYTVGLNGSGSGYARQDNLLFKYRKIN